MIKKYFDFKFNEKELEFSEYPQYKIELIREDLLNGNVVVLKNFFDFNSMIDLRSKIHESFISENFTNPPLSNKTENFIRRDNNPEKSAVKRVKQFAVSFYWNKPFFREREYFLALTYLRNRIANLPLNYTSQQIEPDGYLTYPNITHYPLGGGRLNKHTDPPNKQFCTIMAALSQISRDFDSGGIYYYSKSQKINLEEHLNIGDVYLMNPDIPHGVDTISGDKKNQIDWKSDKGRWILFPAMIEIESLRGIPIKGLQDLGEN